MRLANFALLVVVGWGMLCTPASGQAIYFEDFSSGAPGWTFGPPLCCGVQWKVDALPASVSNEPFFSAPSSLNFNNDSNHAGGNGRGWVRSPLIDLSVATGIPTLSFWCNNRSTEGTCDPHEALYFSVLGHTGECYTYHYGDTPCHVSGWHPHQLVLDASWGRVQFQFDFDSDGLFDEGPGWFVDDVGVYDSPAPTPYCTATVAFCSPLMDWGGALPSATDPTPCWITGSNLPDNTIGMLFYGLNGATALPFLGATLCVAPPLKRTPIQNTGGPIWCLGYMSLDFNRLVRSGADPALLPGQQVHAQWWYRDPTIPSQAGLSQGIELLIQP